MKYFVFFILFFFHPLPSVHDDFVITDDGETIATVNRTELMMPLLGNAMVNTEKFSQLINELDKHIYLPPTNATLNSNGQIVEEKVGYKLDQKRFHELFYTYFYAQGHAEIEIPKIKLYPKVDSELLANIRTQRIGYYVTYFNMNNKERCHNITLANEAINNYVVFPGETFSFNAVVGKRTKEKGYLPAPVIVRGELTEGIGGGICQVSSTLYNAVDHARLQILQRYSHSKRVPYVPPGRDATVSWYGPDFVFKNQHNQPILIQSKTYGGQIIIQIFSSDAFDHKPKNVPSAPHQLAKEIKDLLP
ncbi:VanW family protein [Halalkalibacterium ligniniphilum]|uniref:VanW family protein n=1 Tax=Halalkalibacterium ligniniphilum TaxID=1134413 RepID=UPI0003449516|nr:VanW family protein [Halalkalibacterium ligniniphilum]